MTKLTDLGMFSTLAATIIVAVAALGTFDDTPRVAAAPAAAQEVTLSQDGRMQLTVTASRNS